MNGIVVSSIRHTGTWFTINLFRKAGWKEKGLNAKQEDTTVYHGHMEKETQIAPAIKLSNQYPLIIPFRHPYRIEESWRRREQHGFCTTEKLIECLDILVDRFLPLAPLILPIDSEYKTQALATISSATNTSLQTDWVPVNSKKHTHSLEWSDLSPSDDIKAWCKTNDDFLHLYYAKGGGGIGL